MASTKAKCLFRVNNKVYPDMKALAEGLGFKHQAIKSNFFYHNYLTLNEIEYKGFRILIEKF